MIPLTDKDKEDLKVAISITKQIASGPQSHFGLGAITALLKVFDLANLGVILVGRGGIGKTTILKAVEQLAHRPIFKREFTPAGIKEGFNEFFTDGSITWINQDLSKTTVAFTEGMLRVVSALITDHTIQESCSLYNVDITNATISWLGAATYPIFKRLLLSDLWDGTYRERICRIYQFPYRRNIIRDEDEPPCVHINPLKFDPIEKIKCDRGLGQAAGSLLTHQFNRERTIVYAPRLLKASASLNHRSEVTLADFKFLKCFEFSFQVEHRLGKRLGLASPIYLDAEAVALVGLLLEYPALTPWQIYKFHRTDPMYTVNAVLRNRDTFNWFPADRDIDENSRLIVEPELLELLNHQYDFEQMCVESSL